MYRLFAALPVPPDVSDVLAGLQTGLLGASWRPVQNFHITLRFFGDVSKDRAVDLDTQLAEIKHPPFEVSIEGVGWFGRREPSSVWARVADTDALTALSSQCERAARRLGLTPDKNPFTPHVTLAYLHGQTLEDVEAWAQPRHTVKTPTYWADQFHLYSSHMGGGGPSRYVAEADYPLSAT